MESQRTTKITLGKDGEFIQKEALKMTMPTELRKPNFTPDGSLLILDPIPRKEEYTASGIILPADDRTYKALVVRVGKYITDYKRGDVVMLNLLPEPCMIEGHAYILENQSIIAGKYEPYQEELTPDEILALSNITLTTNGIN